MSSILIKPNTNANDGHLHHITTETANWQYVGFDYYQLRENEKASNKLVDRETLLVLVTGAAKVLVDGELVGEFNSRENIFNWDEKPYSVYVPKNKTWEVVATSNLELAACSAPSNTDQQIQVIKPEDINPVTRGKGANTRHIHLIMMEETPGADSLLVTEVLTPNGNWSSYPPHKHDTNDFPNETFLEEVYYHRFNPNQGYGHQRIYTDDLSLDETITFHDGDVTLVPKGYHPVGAPYGYELYYLNVMAGPRRNWRFTNDPKHDWIFQRDK